MRTPLLALAILTIAFTSCNSGSNSSSDLNSDTALIDSSLIVSLIDTTQQDQVSTKPTEPTSKWSYNEMEDKMTSKKTFIASVDALELLVFDFPYNGGSLAWLTLRKKRNETNVYLKVSKGQFNTSMDGGSIRVRFDKNPPKTYSFSGSSDGSHDIIFIDNELSFIRNLKKAKKLLIEVEFYNEGYRQIEFDVSGLKWAH